MADVSIKQGDRLPKLSRQFLLNGVAVNLTSSTVTFDMWNAETGGQVIVGGACVITSAVNGQVEYAWTSTDATLSAGSYLAHFTASYSGSKLTAPNNGMIVVEIYASTDSEWSYTGNPATRMLDKVRFLVGDTDSNNQLIKDNEIIFLLTEWNDNPYVAASNAAYSLSAQFASKGDYSKSVGDLSISTQYGAQADRYKALGASLAAQASQSAPPSPTFYTNSTGDVGHTTKFSIGMGEFT